MEAVIQDNRWPAARPPLVIRFETAAHHRVFPWLRLRFAPDIPVRKSGIGMTVALLARRYAPFGEGCGE